MERDAEDILDALAAAALPDSNVGLAAWLNPDNDDDMLEDLIAFNALDDFLDGPDDNED